MPTALIAEDEPLLAQALQAELTRAWPELQVLRTVGDGASAVKAALELVPQLLFFDIRMPGMSGLDAALELADLWPPAHAPQQPFPALVFVTAYDQYAVQAFEAQAVDYLLKPVQPARLQKTVSKLQLALADSARAAPEIIANPATDPALEAALSQLRGLLQAHTGMPAQAADASSTTPLLQVLQVSAGSQIRMVPIDEVLYFEAADKYVRVLTREREHLLRTALKDLLPQLDPQVFWQVHRGTVVRATAIDTVSRDDAGRLTLSLRNRDDKLAVSRLYAQRFKAM
ncbi:MAG: DNA-binding response regulator [Betaproteobacteria bacterium]|nr:DNA-binding response regulator [Betaproteobacteria bacterium]